MTDGNEVQRLASLIGRAVESAKKKAANTLTVVFILSGAFAQIYKKNLLTYLFVDVFCSNR